MNFGNDRCEEFQARFQNLSQPNQTPGTVFEALNHMEAFYKACGGITGGGKVFGLGSAAFEYYGDHLPLRRPSSSRVDEAFTSIDDAGNRITLQTVQERLDVFNDERAGVLEHLQRMNARQERLEQSVDGLRSEAHSNENGEILERLTYLEAQMAPMMKHVQQIINHLRSEHASDT
ncbi:hypothetical protein M5689_006695 [Euphorbia peplus]|nr:hypothetical protein M5689_006695 [Euphorbia peplus]